MIIKKSLAWGQLEKGFVGFVLFFATSPLTLWLGRGDPSGDGSSLVQTIWACIYIISLMLIIPHLNRFAFVITRDKVMLAILGLATLSTLWSIVPEITIRRTVALIGTTIFAAYFAMRFSMEEQLHRLAWMFLFAAVASIIVVFIWPQYGIDQASVTIRGNIGTWWQGIYHQKAVLGRHMSLATLIFFFLLHQQHWKWIIRFGFVSCLLLLYLTSSRTAQAALIVSLASLPFIILLRRRWHFTLTIPLLIVSLAMVALGIFLFIELIPVVTAFLGRSPTLTGRTILWSDVIRMIQEKPLLGYGLSGFWLGWDGPSARVWLYRTWLPRYAHNGFMDLTLQLGIVGLAFFLYHFLRTSYYSLCWNQRYHNLHDLWPLCFLVYMVVTNIADTSILSRNNLMWILYLSLTLTMIIHQRQPEIPKNGESILPELQTNLAAPST